MIDAILIRVGGAFIATGMLIIAWHIMRRDKVPLLEANRRIQKEIAECFRG